MRPFPGPLLLVGAVLLAAPSLGAYPIPPVTLWQLTAEADLIVVARVAAVESPPNPGKNFAFEGDIARLHVLEVWKGSIDS